MPRKTEKPMVKLWCNCSPTERPPRFLRPFLLLLLREQEGHRCELIDRMRERGLEYSIQGAGYVYRTLRSMEAKGLITSEWNMANAGPAKRVYAITLEEVRLLHEWAQALRKLTVIYREARYRKLLGRYPIVTVRKYMLLRRLSWALSGI